MEQAAQNVVEINRVNFDSNDATDLSKVSTTEVKHKYYLIIGTSGNGKSTVANAIIDKHYDEDRPFNISGGLVSGTTNTYSHEIGLFKIEKKTYTLHIIDAVGFFDGKNSNRKVLQDIKAIMQKNSEYILDRIIFVFSYGRPTQEDRDSVQLVFNEFGPAIKDVSVACITHAEDLSDEKRKEEIYKFQTSQESKEIADRMSDVLMIGIKQYSEIPDDMKESKEKYKAIGNKDAHKLRDFILKNKYQIKFRFYLYGLYSTIETIDITKK